MKKNEKVRVDEDCKFHAGRIAYFQFFGNGPSKNVAVLSVAPVQEGQSAILFAVGRKEIAKV